MADCGPFGQRNCTRDVSLLPVGARPPRPSCATPRRFSLMTAAGDKSGAGLRRCCRSPSAKLGENLCELAWNGGSRTTCPPRCRQHCSATKINSWSRLVQMGDEPNGRVNVAPRVLRRRACSCDWYAGVWSLVPLIEKHTQSTSFHTSMLSF